MTEFHNNTKLCNGTFDQQEILDRLEKLEKIVKEYIDELKW